MVSEQIIPFDSSYLENVISMYEHEFSRFRSNPDENREQLNTFLKPEKTLLVLMNDILVGFSCFDTLHHRDEYLYFLDAALNPGKYDPNILSWLKEKRPLGEPLIEYFPEFFKQLSDIRIRKNDVHIAAFAIHPDFRKNGIGTKLATATLQIIEQNMNPSSVYATIVENSPAYDIALNSGFIPLIKVGPYYDDGSAVIAVVKKLK